MRKESLIKFRKNQKKMIPFLRLSEKKHEREGKKIEKQ